MKIGLGLLEGYWKWDIDLQNNLSRQPAMPKMEQINKKTILQNEIGPL